MSQKEKRFCSFCPAGLSYKSGAPHLAACPGKHRTLAGPSGGYHPKNLRACLPYGLRRVPMGFSGNGSGCHRFVPSIIVLSDNYCCCYRFYWQFYSAWFYIMTTKQAHACGRESGKDGSGFLHSSCGTFFSSDVFLFITVPGQTSLRTNVGL